MEVHHHTHTPRKKWTHYFWEFLMLFLAVFCGFLAENQREHFIEHRREKQYMQSMVEDLQSDTLAMDRVIKLARLQRANMDSLIEFGNYYPMNDENIMTLYKLNGQINRILNIRFEDRTTSQLKNAGGMRLIRKKIISDSIRKYWATIERLEGIRDRLERVTETIGELSSQIFNNKYIVYSEMPLEPPKEIKVGAKLMNNDPGLITQFINRIVTKRNRTNLYLANLKECNQLAGQLIAKIKNEYHLK